MSDVPVARAPLEEPVVVPSASSQVPAIRHILRSAPERVRPKGHRGHPRPLPQHREDGLHVLGPVELIDVDLPQVVAGRALRVGPRLRRAVTTELVRLRPEAVAGDDLDLVRRVFLGLEALQRLQRAVDRVTVGRRDRAGVLVAALDDDDLMRERVERAQAVARERLAVQHDDAERHPRPCPSPVVAHIPPSGPRSLT